MQGKNRMNSFLIEITRAPKYHLQRNDNETSKPFKYLGFMITKIHN